MCVDYEMMYENKGACDLQPRENIINWRVSYTGLNLKTVRLWKQLEDMKAKLTSLPARLKEYVVGHDNTLRSKMLSQADRNYSTRSQSSQACGQRKWAPPVKVIRSQNHRGCIPPASTISFSAMHQVLKEANNYL